MAISSQSRSGDLSQLLQTNNETVKDQIRVAIPGIIQSFNSDTVTAVVLPAIKYVENTNDGKKNTSDYPLLVDVPVVFPRGGGCTLTFPVNPGDECIVVFADRCIDFWWQNGGVQEPVASRQHDMSDALCILGPMSQAKKISNISMKSAQLRTDSGSAFIEIAQCGNVTITSPKTTINGPLQVNGTITSTGDQKAGSISQMNHTHGGVKPGEGNTGRPQ